MSTICINNILKIYTLRQSNNESRNFNAIHNLNLKYIFQSKKKGHIKSIRELLKFKINVSTIMMTTLIEGQIYNSLEPFDKNFSIPNITVFAL